MKIALLSALAVPVLMASAQALAEDPASRSSMIAAFTKVLHDWDRNGDGKLSKAEARALADAAFPSKYFAREDDAKVLREKALADFVAQDADKDGFLTLDELLKEPTATFQCIDINRDGVLQQEEIDAGVSRCATDEGEPGRVHDAGFLNPASAEKEVPFGPPKPLNEKDWLYSSDFKAPEFRNFPHGSVHLILDVSSQGQVTHCTTQSSSADAQVDASICNLLIERARFRPAGDPSKHPVEATHSRQFTW